MATGQDIRMVDIPQVEELSPDALVYINNKGTLRQASLSDMVVYSRMYEQIAALIEQGVTDLNTLSQEQLEALHTAYEQDLASLGDAAQQFRAEFDLDAWDARYEELKKSVSDGKTLVASAITAKKVPTAANATFQEMADNINAITLGSGNATKAQVLAGRTFTNDDGVEYTGEMPDNGAYVMALNADNLTNCLNANVDLKGPIPKGCHSGDGYVHIPISVLKTFYNNGVTAGQNAYAPATLWTGSQQAAGTVSKSLSGYTYVALYFYNFWGTDDTCHIIKVGASCPCAVYSDDRTQMLYWRSVSVKTSGVTLGAVMESSTKTSVETNVLILTKIVGLKGTIY